MSKPQLTVFAGCNGSGKSTFSKSFILQNLQPFDFDLQKRKRLDTVKFDFEFNEEIAHQQTLGAFESLIQTAIDNKQDFAYETNFNYNPLKWPEIFKKAGYRINLVFLILKTIQQAKERVDIRVQNGGLL